MTGAELLEHLQNMPPSRRKFPVYFYSPEGERYVSPYAPQLISHEDAESVKGDYPWGDEEDGFFIQM